MTRLILHVGMDKTGTTAIQHALHQDRKALLANAGVLIPATGTWVDHSHHPFAFAAFETGNFKLEDLDRLFTELGEEVAATGVDTILMSSECLFKLPLARPESPFFEHVARMFDEVSAIAYVRRQDHWVESRYRHSIISGHELTLEQLSKPNFCDYKRYIDAWADYCGRGGLVLRPFEREQFVGGDIAQDFLSSLGLSIPKHGHGSKRKNTAFHYEDVLFRAAISHLDLPEETNTLINEHLGHREHADEDDKDLLPPEKAARLIEEYEPVNSALARQYLGRSDGVLFREPPPSAVGEPIDLCLSADRIRNIMSGLDRDWPFLSGEIRKGIAGRPPRSDDRPLVKLRLAALATGAGVVVQDVTEVAPLAADNAAVQPVVAKPAMSAEPFPRLQKILRMGRRRWPFKRRASSRPTQPVYVHFGMAQTGSSSIQSTLYRGKEATSAYSYPEFDMANGSLTMSIAFMPQHLHPALPEDTPAQWAGRRQMKRQSIADGLNTAPLDRPCIISGEMIALFDTAVLQEMHQFLAGWGRECIYIGYVREPVSHMKSMIQETLKTQPYKLGQLDPASDPRNLVMNYHEFVNRLDSVVGRESVRLFPYDRSIFPANGIVGHFLEQVGVDPKGLKILNTDDNLPMLAVKLLHVYRKFYPFDQAIPRAQLSMHAFVRDLGKIGVEPFRFHPDLFERIRGANQHVYDWSADRLGHPLRINEAWSDAGLRCSADLETLSFDEVAIFAEHLKKRKIVLPKAPGLHDLADAMHALRRYHAAAVGKV